jgi:hypothetical protein
MAFLKTKKREPLGEAATAAFCSKAQPKRKPRVTFHAPVAHFASS